MYSLCDHWEFTEHWSEAFARGEGEGETVRLPHTVREVPLHGARPEHYELLSGYRRTLTLPDSWADKRLFLQFDGAAHAAAVYLNGRAVGEHRCGYTAFRIEITDLVRPGEDNLLAVRLDSRESLNIPPFGFVIDYLTYGGLYREVWLDVRERSYIEDLFVTGTAEGELSVSIRSTGKSGGYRLTVLDGEGRERLTQQGTENTFRLRCPEARPWSPESPVLYTCRAELLDENGAVTDTQSARFGFRTAEFRPDGFYLNGKRTFLLGLNRHQCYPYMGYAAPASLQKEDARILKEELSCNAVRTSHYPQSRHFLNACDELGLLVFTEIPGWQHIGDGEWKEQAVENTREMVLQYRNHPSIVLWGVRINESLDDDELYRRTNAVAHELDPSRATSGVRYIEKSHLLEDVYAYNDFSHNGATPGCKKKAKVTPDMSKALLISECNGHMFPTKAWDPWAKRQEHALRHARVQDAAMADGEHAGCFGWCMFDYPTHQDFGSGDRVCYHGVLDAFRNAKLAAALYASQGEERDVLEVGSSMDIGDYPAGQVGEIYVFTNADEVALYKNDAYVTTLRPRGWKGLPHGPIPVEDTIGELLETQEGCDKKKAAALRACLLSAGKHGLANMPATDKARLLWCMLRYRMSFQDGVDLYGKYVGNWGGQVTRWRFEARRAGRAAESVIRAPGGALHIEARPSAAVLREGDSYDMAAVRIRLLDEYGNTAPYAQLPLRLELEGDAALVGPDTVTAEGGMCGTYVRTLGRAGRASLRISAPDLAPVSIHFTIEKQEERE